MEGEYHGIMIKESLKDQSVLQRMRTLGKKVSGSWTLLRVRVDGEGINEIVKLAQQNLLTEKGVPYYAHFYRGEELIVIFPEKIFHVTPDKKTWGPVIKYGLSMGIPKDEMDIKPCRFEDETY